MPTVKHKVLNLAIWNYPNTKIRLRHLAETQLQEDQRRKIMAAVNETY